MQRCEKWNDSQATGESKKDRAASRPFQPTLMPKSFILSYVEDKMMKDHAGQKDPGPVITIARDYGCPGVPVAEAVTKALTNYYVEWKLIDKEIINHAAQELRVSPEVAERIGHSGPRGFAREAPRGDEITRAHGADGPRRARVRGARGRA